MCGMCEFDSLEPYWGFQEIGDLGKRFASLLKLDIIVYSFEIQALVIWWDIVLAGLGELIISEMKEI